MERTDVRWTCCASAVTVKRVWQSAKGAFRPVGAEGAAEIIFREDSKDPEKKQKKIDEYKQNITSPFVAASRGYLDDIIKPQNTRWRICKGLKYLRTKKVNMPWKKHDNLPL